MIPRYALVALAGSLALVSGAAPEPARACARVSRGPVSLVGEEALIVWDPSTHTEHFIRTAVFSGATEHFGFLVPTPSRPELAEAPTAVFDKLFALYYTPRPIREEDDGRGGLPRAQAVAPAVQVLERREVAGMDASVLRAADADALDEWLRGNDYPSGDPLRRWLAPYVRRGWIVTAFRYDPRGDPERFASRAVRMSFETDRPYFPYSEPPGGDHTPRPFRVSLLAPTRMRPRGAFRGRVGFAGRLDEDAVDDLLRGVLSPIPFGGPAWLTVFDEPASVRGRTDLFFDRAPPRPQRSRIHTRILPGGRRAGGSDSPIQNPFDD